jgi:anti-sigma B factor antagonist
METGSNIVIQKMWDVTVVNVQEARLVEGHQIEQMSQQLFQLVDEMDRKKLIVDFAKVQFLASAAVGMLLNLHKKSAAIKGTMIICGLRKELMQVFEIMQLTKILKFAPDEGKALKMLGYSDRPA